MNSSGTRRTLFGWTARRSLSVLVLALLATAVGLALAAFSVSAHPQKTALKLARAPRLAVFSGHLKARALRASVDGRAVASNAVLAETVGQEEVYVAQGSGLVCLRVRADAASESGVCNKTEQVDVRGMLSVNVGASGRIRIGLVLPNNVGQVTLTDQGGLSHSIAVTNNVAVAYDSNIEAVEYVLPDGSVSKTPIPAEVTHPKPPTGA